MMIDDIRAELERTQALIDDLRKKIEAQEAKAKRNWPEKIEAGMVFHLECFGTWMSLGKYGYACISGDRIGAHADAISYTDFAYLGHARDILTIRTDAHEPTGAELVGRVCEYSDDGNTWEGLCECRRFDANDIGMAYRSLKMIGSDGGERMWFKYARLAK